MTVRLSFAQVAALRLIRAGESRPNVPQPVLDALVRHGYLAVDNNGYQLTDKGAQF